MKPYYSVYNTQGTLLLRSTALGTYRLAPMSRPGQMSALAAHHLAEIRPHPPRGLFGWGWLRSEDGLQDATYTRHARQGRRTLVLASWYRIGSR